MATISAESSESHLVTRESTNEPVATLLESTAGKCQILAKTLRQENIVNNNENTNSGRKLDSYLLEENIRLRAMYQDELEANKRWQKWNVQREEYIQKLLKAVRETELGSNNHNPPDFDVNLKSQENSKLSEFLRQKSKEVEMCKKIISDLKQTLEKNKAEYKENIHFLEMQIRAYRDDWDAERREKIETEHREIEAKEQLLLTESKLRKSEQKVRDLERCRCQCHQPKSMEGSLTEPIIRQSCHSSSKNFHYLHNSSRLIPRSKFRNEIMVLNGDFVVSDGKADLPPSPNDQPELRPSTPPPSSSSLEASANSEKNKTRQCPECGKEFPEHVHHNFLEHFEICNRRTIL